MKLTAICQGFSHNGKFVTNKNGMVMDVPNTARNCPVCGFTLLWIAEKPKIHRNEKAKRRRIKNYLGE